MVSNTDASNGTVVVNADGSYVYTPDAGFSGADSFEYTISDGEGGQDTATVSINVEEVVAPPPPPPGPSDNNPPVAIDDSATTSFETPFNGNVLVNDSDPDGDAITVVSNTDASNGTVVVNADGSYVYTPDAGFSGADSFEYTISDGEGGQDTATVSINVEEVVAPPPPPPGPSDNNPPVAIDDSATTSFETPFNGNVLVNDSDPDGDAITVVSNTDASNGTVVVNADGSYVYTPDAGFSGADSFEYTISDGEGGQDTATVSINVEEVVAPPPPPPGPSDNNPPVAIDDSATTSFETPFNGNVLVNDSDPDGDAITVVSNTDASNGTVVVNADGSYVYTPDAGFSGADSFEYTISDGEGGQDTATVSINVEEVVAPPPPPPGPSDNNPPVAIDDSATTSFETPFNGNVLVNDSDPDGDAITVVSNTDASNGTVVVNADGSYVYTPDAGFSGADSFEYTISDGEGGRGHRNGQHKCGGVTSSSTPTSTAKSGARCGR